MSNCGVSSQFEIRQGVFFRRVASPFVDAQRSLVHLVTSWLTRSSSQRGAQRNPRAGDSAPASRPTRSGSCWCRWPRICSLGPGSFAFPLRSWRRHRSDCATSCSTWPDDWRAAAGGPPGGSMPAGPGRQSWRWRSRACGRGRSPPRSAVRCRCLLPTRPRLREPCRRIDPGAVQAVATGSDKCLPAPTGLADLTPPRLQFPHPDSHAVTEILTLKSHKASSRQI